MSTTPPEPRRPVTDHPPMRDRPRSKLYAPLVTLGLILTVVLIALVVGTEWWDQDAPLNTFKPEGPAARTIQDLVSPVFIIAGVVFVLVQVAVVYLSVKYRRQDNAENGDDLDFPKQTHGNVIAEIGWTAIPFLLLLTIGVATVLTIFELEERDPDALDVTVVGQQWWWAFEYDADDDGKTDIVTASEMVIPAGRQVNLTIKSQDVIHSFWIPPLNGKRDAVPGRETTLSLEADEPGRYRGQCTEFCGLSHARMQMYVIALPPDEYEAWVANQLKDAELDGLEAEAEAGRELFDAQCTRCHLVEGMNEDDYKGAEQISGTAPNLTHFMSREKFAGATLDTYLDERTEDVSNYLSKEGLKTNSTEIAAWLRNPEALKPMAPTPVPPNEFGRGMPDLGLTEQQISDLIAFLETLD